MFVDFYQNRSLRWALSVTGAFWCSEQLMQRVAGALRITSAHPGIILSGFGLVSFASSLFIVDGIADSCLDRKDQPGSRRYKNISNPSRRELLKRFYSTALVFTLLEWRLFQSMVPSSILATGVFATLKGSIPTSNPIASETQRQLIQKYGKKYGCHQCGNMQLLSRKPFIADHMPPTAMVVNANKKWWRRILRFTIDQRLFPQCQFCYSIQGNAVKKGVHIPVYHHSLRLAHISPVLAPILLSNVEAFEDMIDSVVYYTERFIDRSYL